MDKYNIYIYIKKEKNRAMHTILSDRGNVQCTTTFCYMYIFHFIHLVYLFSFLSFAAALLLPSSSSSSIYSVILVCARVGLCLGCAGAVPCCCETNLTIFFFHSLVPVPVWDDDDDDDDRVLFSFLLAL